MGRTYKDMRYLVGGGDFVCSRRRRCQYWVHSFASALQLGTCQREKEKHQDNLQPNYVLSVLPFPAKEHEDSYSSQSLSSSMKRSHPPSRCLATKMKEESCLPSEAIGEAITALASARPEKIAVFMMSCDCRYQLL